MNLPRPPAWSADVGLLVLRLTVGPMMLFGHGLPKLLTFAEHAATFPDPLGVGSSLSLTLAILGEVVGSSLIALGLATRAAAVPFVITMIVAGAIVHGDDPWSRKELALLYAVPAITLIFTGAGRFSVDGWLARRRDAAGEKAASEAA